MTTPQRKKMNPTVKAAWVLDRGESVMAMDPDIKERWVAALRSDRFKQGKEYLRSVSYVGRDSEVIREEYCCLGVLCQLAVEDKVIEPPYFSVPSQVYFYDGCDAFLPASVAQWASIGPGSADPEVPSENVPLSTLNDRGVSFRRIANFIDAEF